MREPPLTIAVIGCGLIGQSWSALFCAHGHRVIAWDPDGDALEAARARMEPALAQLAELGVNPPAELRFALARSLEDAVSCADWVQENGPERLELKHDLYRAIEAAADPRAVIASSTSSLVWSDLSQGMTVPERLITAHPFNPPHLMPLVEIYAVDTAVSERAHAFYRGLGKQTVRLRKDAVGHIANRLSSALWREAVNMVAEGIADVADIDRALVHGPGLRWSVVGAHMGYHLGGGPGGIAHYLAHLGASQERRWQTLGQPSLSEPVCEALVEGVADECDGRSIPELEARRDAALISVLRHRGTLS